MKRVQRTTVVDVQIANLVRIGSAMIERGLVPDPCSLANPAIDLKGMFRASPTILQQEYLSNAI